MTNPIKKLSQIRLLKWYLPTLALFIVIILFSSQQLSVVVYKLALVLLSVAVGYHLDRALFPYSSPSSYIYHDWKIHEKDSYTKLYVKDGEDQIPTKYAAEYPVLSDNML